MLILQTSGKIKPKIKIDEDLGNTLDLGKSFHTSFGEITRLQTGYYSDQIYEITLRPEVATNSEACSFVIKSVKWGGSKGKLSKVKTRYQATPVKEIQALNLIEQMILPRAAALKKIYPFFPTLAVA